MKIHSSLLAVLLLAGGAEAALRGRRLSYDTIAGYEPTSDVSEHAKIDLDLEQMIDYLESGDFTSAQDVYENGAHSGGYASFNITGLASAVTAGTAITVSQASPGNTDATGYVKSDAASGDTALTVYYTSTCIERGTNADTTGCFDLLGDLTISATSGDVTVALADLNRVETKYRTLQGFSTGANAKMSDQVFFQDFEVYYRTQVSQYGSDEGAYGDMHVLQALKTPTAAQPDDKFYGLTSNDSREEAAAKAAAYLNVWMYVVREMEDAVDDCDASNLARNDDYVQAWDEAVAFYVGSLEGDDGTGSGNLLYALADKRCLEFGTCDDDDSKTSHVNEEVMELFDTGKAQMLSGECSGLIGTKDSIVEHMTVPLVQGTLRYMYKLSYLSGGDKELAEGHTFAAAILPRLAICDPDAATLLAKNLLVNGSTLAGSMYDQPWVMADGFATLKAELEENYACLGFTCDDIGGLLQTDGSYYSGAEPCDSGDSSSGLSAGAIAGIVICVLLFVAAVVTACYYKRRADSKHEAYKGMQEEMKAMKEKYPGAGGMTEAFEVSN